jgi:hypothetical protein
MSLSVVLLIFWIAWNNLSEGKVSLFLVLGVFFICLYVTCYLVDLHTVAAEALMVCFLTEYDLDERWTYRQMRYCPENLKKLMNDVDKEERKSVYNSQ